jgi:hypothetical protein
MSFEEAKQYLTQEVNGTSLFEHLSSVLLKIINEKPSNPVDVFEHISGLVKQTTLKPAGDVEVDAQRENEAVNSIVRLLCCYK